MKRFLDAHRALVIAGVAGAILFLVLYAPAFMHATRPQPLSRDEVTVRAMEFAAREGWNAPGRAPFAIPIEGDDYAIVAREAGGAEVDRETLPDPAWEVNLITNPGSLLSSATTFQPPDPILSIALTPTGEVVQYLEASTTIRSDVNDDPATQRMPPMAELSTDWLFTVAPEDSLAADDAEREATLALVRQFFTRHAIAVAGDPQSFGVYDGPGDSRIALLEWQSPGPHDTAETTRVAVRDNRVVAYDRDLRAREPLAARSRAALIALQIANGIQSLIYLAAGAIIAGLIVIRRRLGELDVRGALWVFLLLLGLVLAGLATTTTLMLAIVASTAGSVQFWFSGIGAVLGVTFSVLLLCGLIAGAWAVGEGQAYLVWPRTKLRPFSSFVRGDFRAPGSAEQVAVGYLLAFAALGVIVVFGLVAPASEAPSVAPYLGLMTWPIWFAPATQALTMGLAIPIFTGLFAMTYVRTRTRRLWLVLLAGIATTFAMKAAVAAEEFFPAASWAAQTVVLFLYVLLPFIFVRYGPLAQAVTVFSFVVMSIAYPLVLSGNAGHAASGAWLIAVMFAPAAAAAYGVWRPADPRAGQTVPVHVRRSLDRLRITEEFDVARDVQARLLPVAPPVVPGLDIAGVCIPANEVGGDYFDYFELPEGRLGIAVGDVSGKGVGAAIYMTLTKSYMVTQAPLSPDPVHALARVNSHLRRNLARGTFVTMAYAIVDPVERRIHYTRAGHNPPLLIRANGEGDYLSAPGLALGAAGAKMFEMATHVETVDLEPGDLLLLYSDGITEAMDMRNDEYGEDRLATIARRLATSPASAASVVEALLRDIRNFSGRAPQHDDITLVAVRVT